MPTTGETMSPRGRKPMTFAREPENAADRRKMMRALASVQANAAKIAEVEHMLDLAKREMVRVIRHAAESGVTHAEMARVYGLTTSRIGQLLKENGG